ADELHGLADRRRRPSVQADLCDALRFLGYRYHLLSFGDGQAERLLDIDVLARPAGGHELQGMPVIRRGDRHGVDVLAVEEFTEIVVQPGPPADVLVRRREIRLVDVAEPDDFHVLVAQERTETLIAA